MVFEGMMVCGAIVGAQKGYLYIRHEYELQTEVLNEELDHASPSACSAGTSSAPVSTLIWKSS